MSVRRGKPQIRRAALARRAALVLLSCGIMAAADPSTPQSRMDEPQWAARFAERREALRGGPFDLVFFGDSITRELETAGDTPWSDIRAVWDRWFACRHAIELGIVGDTTANLLWRIDNGLLPQTPPKVAVVLIGTNNNRPRLGWTADQTAQGIVAVVADLHRRLKKTRILVLGVPPNGHGARVEQLISGVNARLAATDWPSYNATFVPISDLFEQNGTLLTDLFREPHQGRPALHPDAQGWEKIAERITRLIVRDIPGPAGVCPNAPASP